MAASPFMLRAIQHGLESTAGTAVAATFKHFGNGSLKFDESINPVGFEYAAGLSGGIVESTFIADTGSTLTLEDTEFSAEAMVWLGNMGIKSVVGAATSFPFTFPTTSANTIKSFTWEMATSAQEYEFAYGTCTKFSVHGDAGANNGRIMYNAEIQGRAASASTLTASLGFLSALQPLNINYATWHLDALGTAAGTASATSNYLRAFNVDVVTGWELRKYADGRSAKDGSAAVYSNYEITGSIKVDLDSATVTRIANARAGTGEVMAIKCNGTSSRLVTFALPLSWTEISALGENDNGIIPVTFNFRSGYSTTATAQGPSIAVTTASSTTVT